MTTLPSQHKPEESPTGARPVVLGVVGDSATGKTTLTEGIVRAVGEDSVAHIATDDYHKYDRQERKELGITPLNPDCNYIDIMSQHLALLRAGEPILKPIYLHSDGTFGAPEYVEPKRFAVVEGLLGYHTPDMREMYDVRVYLAPPEDLRRKLKISRDTGKRGYTEEEVHEQLDEREPDSQAFIRPQEAYADITVTFRPEEEGEEDFEHLACDLKLRAGLEHPDLAALCDAGVGITMEEGPDHELLYIPGHISADQGRELEEMVWGWMHFARHLQSEEIGQFEAGDEMRRSESLALVQLLLLYHLVTAKAAVALGSDGARTDGLGAQSQPDEEEGGESGEEEAGVAVSASGEKGDEEDSEAQ